MQVQLLSNALFIYVVLFFFPINSNAGEPVSKNYLTGIAFGGHDSVAYHRISSNEPNRAIEGKKAWKAEWKGADWLFSNEADRDLFVANPERYSPAYNGFCANALSLGEGLFKTDGTHWQIFEDQLYSFFAARGRERWLAGDFKMYKATADKAWKNIISK